MATNRDSTLYSNVNVSQYISDARDKYGSAIFIRFDHTVVSGETGGASAGVQDSVNLCVLPAFCEVIFLIIVADAIWASAATNGTLQLGDSGDDDRYLTATEFYTAAPGGPIATEGIKRTGLALTGQNYKPTANTIVVATWKTANPVVGKTFRGGFIVVPAL